MTKPLPWSYSALDTFKNCPRQYQAKYVLKSIKEPPTQELLWGRKVHKAFEDRLAVGAPLPDELAQHEPYMAKLDAKPGVGFTEQKIALTTKLKPCSYFEPDVWYRGAIDYKKVDADRGYAAIIDHKTGKPHQKFEQLASFAIHTFILHPNVNLVDARFYWTTTKNESRKVWSRDDVPALWGYFLPDLKQYKEAFETDVWTPRKSGLCRGWCPVKDCEFWEPKKERY